MRTIVKIGLAVRRKDTILLVRKRGTTTLILPGGKPHDGENDCETLNREISEELGCTIRGSIQFLGEFKDIAAELEMTRVIVRLYEADLSAEPRALAEIDRVHWYSLDQSEFIELAPSLKNHIIPFLNNVVYISAGSSQSSLASS